LVTVRDLDRVNSPRGQWKRGREVEILEVVGPDRLPTVEDLDKMKYLNKVFKESLRIRPPVPQVTRVTEEDTELGGYIIPKGTACVPSIYALHHLPNLWDEPEVFNPERWEDDETQFGAYIPFLLGSRNCVGSRFATLEVKSVLCMVLRKYKFSIPEGHPPIQRRATAIMKPFPYLNLNVTKR